MVDMKMVLNAITIFKNYKINKDIFILVRKIKEL